MNVATTDARKERFITLLHELFQLDKPELDFGLYRIMHAKSDQLSRFIREDLSQAIEEAFAEQGEQQLATMRQEIEEKRRQAEELGAPDPDSAPAVRQARAAYDVAKREQNASADIYDHLYRFFSRYYDKGDFMSRRHHVAENDSRAAPYAVPYDGREVYLHWANKDQYYVKSSETLANFTFNLNDALKKLHGSVAQGGLGFDSVDAALKVHCRVVDATEGEHNDVKESTERFFIIHHDEPVRLDGADLVLQFEYRPDPEKTGQSGTWQKKRLEEAEELIMAGLRITDGVAAYRDGLATPAPTDKQKSRTLLGKYLQQYTARNTMDYFIHKDLGGFLSRELDFYIKNEILRLDDIDNAGVLIVEQQLKKIQVLRKIAKQIIAFLAQLENFQKKLWLKKKFVVGVDYCVTLDLLESREDLVRGILLSEAQLSQWGELYSVDVNILKEFFENHSFREFLEEEKHKHLMVDTATLSDEIKSGVVAFVSGLVEGVAVNGDNFQSLRLMESSYAKSFGLVYIDPPYNTGGGDFSYKDSYRSSSWLSFVYDRMSLGRKLQTDVGNIVASIDDNEVANLIRVLNLAYGENELAKLVWDRNRKNDARYFSVGHEYMLVWSMSREKLAENSIVFREPKEGIEDARKYFNSVMKEYGDNESSLLEKWLEWFEGIPVSDPKRRMLRFNKVSALRGPYRDDGDLSWPGGGGPKYDIAHPETRKICKKPSRGWIFPTKERFWEEYDKGRIGFGKDEGKVPSGISYLFEGRNEQVMPSVFYSYAQAASQKFDAMFGYRAFDNPKNWSDLERVFSYLTKGDGTVLDYYAGSGSSAHACIELKRKGGDKISYVLAEVDDCFYTVLIPRIKKAVYSDRWKGGAPQPNRSGDLDGVSHCFKYLRLESYDDTLNNLELDDNPKRDALIEKNPELRRDYTLKYLLDVETRGSASLLNTEWFRDPEGYTLKVKQPGSDETRETAVDLVETFNWLIGLHVTHLDKPRTYVARFEREQDPELPEDQNTRLKTASLRENEDGAYWIRQVEGHVRRIPGSDEDLAKVLVVWRKLTDDPEKDAAVLEALLAKVKIGTTDSEFDAIYINGPHGLNLTGSARSRVHSLEETFHARMWEGCDDDL
ncbi:DNA methyltransferase [Salinicola halophyticus]|uniref:DNA methyltransferase n=1 Tax=Salinicola halophyticus TaxID=1808881 RepID=UPI003F477D8B